MSGFAAYVLAVVFSMLAILLFLMACFVLVFVKRDVCDSTTYRRRATALHGKGLDFYVSLRYYAALMFVAIVTCLVAAFGNLWLPDPMKLCVTIAAIMASCTQIWATYGNVVSYLKDRK